MRLQKILADAGLFSRRKAEEAITDGLVTVNGAVVTQLGAKADPYKDTITFDGQPVKGERKVYLLLNKPAGVISSTHDPEGRKTVTDILDHVSGRLYPVGRLDYNTTGVLLLTNDGDFANLMMHPSSSIVKHYHARVSGKPTGDTLRKMERGITVEGVKYAFKKVKLLRITGKNSVLHVELEEGKKHQIRILCQSLGHPVVRLHRAAYGPIKPGKLKPGDYRHLSEKEVKALAAAAKGTAKQPRKGPGKKAR